LRTPFAEVDLLFSKTKDSKELLLVEVKRCAHAEYLWKVLSLRQKRRLVRALTWYSERGFHVQGRLLLVHPDHSLTEIQDAFSD
jgi:Holliday junction resolvase-like predicted endonuclease